MNARLEQEFKSNKRSWSPDRRRIAVEALHLGGDGGTLDKEGVDHLIERLYGGRRPKKKQIGNVRAVLKRLSVLNYLDAHLPPMPMPLVRPSVIPSKGEDFCHLPVLDSLRAFFWKSWLPDEGLERAFPLGFALSLVLDGGFIEPSLTWLLTRLTCGDVRDGEMWILVGDEDGNRTKTGLGLPASAELLFSSYVENLKVHAESYLLVPKLERTDHRRRAVKSVVAEEYSRFAAAFLSSTRMRAPSWLALPRLGLANLVLRHGLEPVIATASSSLPPPAADPADVALLMEWQNRELPSSSLLDTKQALRAVMAGGSADDETARRNVSDWCAMARRVVHRLNARLQSISQPYDGAFTYQVAVCEAQEAIDAAQSDADKLSGNQSSALHLALRWTRSLLSIEKRADNPVYKTIETYLSRVFTSRILMRDESIDFGDWEQEDHETMVQEFLEEDGLSTKTRIHIARTLSSVYRFGHKEGFLPRVKIHTAAMEVIAASSRSMMIWPHEFDSFISRQLALGTREGRMHAVCAILGYYAGLRPAELMRLTAEAIDYGNEACYLSIYGGKSTAARRRVALHRIAPPEYVRIVIDFWKERAGEFEPDLPYDKIAFFGVEGRVERLRRSGLLTPLVRELKLHFGKKAVFYTLRHCFASMLFLRWYVMQYPDALPDQVKLGQHVFSREAEERLTYFFAELGGDHARNRDRPDALTRISKAMGHVGQQTLFRHYVHTFSIVHRHAMQRMNRELGELALPGKTIAVLLPRAKSRATQAKLPGKTILALNSYMCCQ